MAKISSTMRKKMEERKKKIKTGGGGLGYIIIKEGTKRLRPLPVKTDEEPGYEIQQIYLGKDLGGGFISPASVGKKCAFVEFYTENIKSKDKVKKAIATAIAPKQRFVMPVAAFADLKGKEIDDRDSPKLVLITGGLYQSCIDLFLDNDDWGDFTDPDDGYDLKFSRTGTGKFDTEYTVMPCSKTKLPKKFRGKTYDAVEMLKAIIPSYEETKEKLKEFMAAFDEEPEEDDDAPKKKFGNKNGKKKLGKKSKSDL